MAISKIAFRLRRGWLPLGVLLLGLAAGWLFLVFSRGPFAPRASIAGPVVLWSFEPAEPGAFVSTPLVTEDFVYAAAVRDSALAPSGVVYCLKRRNGRVLWKFDDDGAMQQTCSSPCLADGGLFIGEGMHGNDVCKMYALDPASPRKIWQFVANGHIESSPCVEDGKLFFGAGDDGLYCLDAATGALCWHFTGSRHIDSAPAALGGLNGFGGLVFAGSGVSRLYSTTEIFCLNFTDGSLHWRTPTELPAWGSPVVSGEDVFFGLGNGRLTQSAPVPEQPAGALLCADIHTGNIRWMFRTRDAVFGRATVDEDRVFFGSRDGRCYCLDRRDGQLRWNADLSSPIVTQPALMDGRLYVVAQGGRIACLDAAAGRELWTFDLARHTQTRPQLLSSPVAFIEENASGRHRRLYFGAELKNPLRNSAVLYCLGD